MWWRNSASTLTLTTADFLLKKAPTWKTIGARRYYNDNKHAKQRLQQHNRACLEMFIGQLG
jgi:hypothetical protein